MRFEVKSIEPLTIEGPPSLLRSELMSPFVWESPDGRLHILIRVVPVPGDNDPVTGRIWYGIGDPDGLSFEMDREPVLVPGPGPGDILGCEDPTVVPVEDEVLVYYTGLDSAGDGELLYARGPDMHSLEKCGVALESSKTERNTKEAEVDRTDDGRWRLFYEYSQEQRSKIGVAIGTDPHGPWEEEPDPFAARAGYWDCWHLSTGPIVMADSKAPVMFYNGADRNAVWGVGWVVFADDCQTVIERSSEPLIAPPDLTYQGRNMFFAASAVPLSDGSIWLYCSRNDRKLFRALVHRQS